MRESIALYRSVFGYLSVLRVVGDFVTHAHREAHIILWLDRNAGEMTVGGQKVRPGLDTAVGINSFEPHSHMLPRDEGWGHFLAFYIDPDWLRCRRGIHADTAVFANPRLSIDPRIRDAAANLFATLTSNGCDDHLCSHEVEGVIDRLMDAADMGRSDRNPASHIPMPHDPRICKAIRLMHANVTTRICFDRLASRVGLSRPHFFALFREQMNVTPNVYWNTLRMEEAFRHLETTEDAVTSVACDLGFSTEGNFSRFFRDHVGVPPTVYRTAVREMAM